MSKPAVFTSASYADALADSKGSDKLLVVDATASWCQPCKTMDRITWADPQVVAWIEENAVAVQIDVDEEKEIATSLGIRSMPTIVVFRNGVEVDRAVGLKRPAELVSWLFGVQHGETNLDRVRKAVQSNPKDMRARTNLAKTLASSRRFDEATDEYAWLWRHMTEHQPSMMGVRMSFMLGEIGRLMQDHPPARQRFVALRDAIGPEGGPLAATATPEQVTDWMALSVTLGEPDRVLAWFDGNRSFLVERLDLERTLRGLVPLLMKRGRWADIGRLLRDPLAALRHAHRRLEEMKNQPPPPDMVEMRPKMVEALEGSIRRDAGLFVASLLAAQRDEEARAVLEEARRLLPGEETERAIQETAQKAGVVLP